MRKSLPIAIAAALSSALLLADDAAFRDSAARMSYGYYAAEPEVIVAAIDELAARSAGGGPVAAVLRAYGEMRLAQLRPNDAVAHLRLCVEHAENVASDEPVGSEALVLTAACSALLEDHEPLMARAHRRRANRALDQAEVIDRTNPRIALVRAGLIEPARTTERLQMLRAAVDAFEHTTARLSWEWGEGDIYLALAEALLEEGNTREARDALERALLAAPGFAQAETLLAEVATR